MNEKQPIAYWQIGISFVRIGCAAFGGGLAVLPILEAELVQRRKWITSTTLTEFYALGQSVPGVIIINTSALVAIHLRGRAAGVLASVAAAFPAFCTILVIASLLQNINDHPWVAAALKGIRPIILAIMAAAAIQLGRKHVRTLYPAFFAGLVGAGLFFRMMSPAVAILGMAILGILLAAMCPAWLQRRMEHEPKAGKGHSV